MSDLRKMNTNKRVRKSKRRCVVCGVSKTSDVLFARFPLEVDRCREWIKAVGDQDLVYLPVQKLNELKYVCGDHFTRNHFTRTRRKLKRKAVPTMNLNKSPLPDNILAEFPLTVEFKKPVHATASEKHKVVSPPLDDDVIDCTMYSNHSNTERDKASEKHQVVSPPPDDDVMDRTMYSDHSDTETDKVIEEVKNFLHHDYKCNNCSGLITGFRYTCVQCGDYDLCSTCEARGTHMLHYVLRVPGPRPYGEIQSVLNTIRYHLGYSCKPGTPIQVANADGLSEIKSEHEEEPEPSPYEDGMATKPIASSEQPPLDQRELPQKQKTTGILPSEPSSDVSSDKNIKSTQNRFQTIRKVVPIDIPKASLNVKDGQESNTSDDVMHDHVNKKHIKKNVDTVYILNKDGNFTTKKQKLITPARNLNTKPYSKEPIYFKLTGNVGVTKNVIMRMRPPIQAEIGADSTKR